MIIIHDVMFMGFFDKILRKKTETKDRGAEAPKMAKATGQVVAENQVPELIQYGGEIQAAADRAKNDLKGAIAGKEPLLITPPDSLKDASNVLQAKYFNQYWMSVAVNMMFMDPEFVQLGQEMKKKIEAANKNKDRADMAGLHEQLNALLRKGQQEEDGMIRQA